jgi:hypothetical protein
LLVECGWWPPQIEFDVPDLNTCISIINEQRKKAK